MRTAIPAIKTQICDLFFLQCQHEKLPSPQRNLRVIESTSDSEGRSRHRVDFCWMEEKICLEVRIFHRADSDIKRQRQRDFWKLAHLQSQGFRVYFASADQVRRGEAIRWISEALELHHGTKKSEATKGRDC